MGYNVDDSQNTCLLISHLDNGLVERLLTELVTPFRRIHLLEEEVVCMSAIIVLNPMARDLTETAAEKCFQFRNRICTTLHQLVKVRAPSRKVVALLR